MSTNKPLVSIGIPAYNHEMYVQSCIQSVIEQDYENIELIIIDDGSNDSTWDRIQEMSGVCKKRFKRFVSLRQENQGAAKTGHRMQEMAQGDFYGGIASDDQYLSGAVSALIQPMIDDPTVGLVVGVNEIMDARGRKCYWDENRKIVYDETKARYRTFTQFIETYSNVDFQSDQFGTYAELIKNNHIPNGAIRRRGEFRLTLPKTDGRVLEDWWFHLQFSKEAKYKAISQHTFRYRWHDANTISKSSYINRAYINTLIAERQLLLNDERFWKFREIARESLRFFEVKQKILGPLKLLVEHRMFVDIAEIGAARCHIPLWVSKVSSENKESR